MNDIYDGLCLLPEDSSGWNSNGSIFEQLIDKLRPSIIIEVGSWKGGSAITMCKALKKFELNSNLYCVDTWLGAEEFWTTMKDTPDRNLLLKNGYPQIYYQFLSNIVHHNFQNYVYPLPLPSDIAIGVLKYRNVKADLIYIDGSHTYEHVLNDIKNYMQILKPGGVIFGDDFHSWPGVKQAVTEVFGASIEIVDNNYWIHEN